MNKFDPSSLPDLAARKEAARLYGEYARLDDDCFTAKRAVVGTAEADSLGAMEAKRDDALYAYEKTGLDLLTDSEGNLIFCALTATPLLADEGDSVLVLRAAVLAQAPELPELARAK